MGLRISTNIASQSVQKNLKEVSQKGDSELEKLSSGKRITKSADDAAGLAIATNLEAQTKGLRQATRNANDGISVIETADGAMTEVHEMLQRLNELAVKSANGTLSDDDRTMIQQEAEQLCSEIDRISDTVEFDTQKLLNGEFDLKAYTTEETEKLELFRLAERLDGNIELAIKQLAESKRNQ